MEYQKLSNLFKHFADPTRLRILSLLENGELSVEELVEKLQMTQSAVSHQLATLRQTEIVKNRREGKRIFYSLKDMHIMNIFNQGVEHIKEDVNEKA